MWSKIVPYIIWLKNHTVHICNIHIKAPDNSIFTCFFEYRFKHYVHKQNISNGMLKHIVMHTFYPMLQIWTLWFQGRTEVRISGGAIPNGPTKYWGGQVRGQYWFSEKLGGPRPPWPPRLVRACRMFIFVQIFTLF